MLNPNPPSFQLYAFPNSPLTATVSTDQLQSNGTVTASTDGTIFKVTRIAALALEWVVIDPGGGPPQSPVGASRRHPGRIIRTQQWVEVASSNGVTPLPVATRQMFLVEMQGVAPASSPVGGVIDHLKVQTGIPGDDFNVPLTLEVGRVVPFLEPAFDINTPMPISLVPGLLHTDWQFDWTLGPPVDVSFRMDTVDTSGFITATFKTTQPVRVQSGPPVSNTIGRTSFTLNVNTPGVLAVGSDHTVYMWMTITSQAGGQVIRTVEIPVRIAS